MGTGFAGALGGGLAGLVGGAVTGDIDNIAPVFNTVADAVTYEPRTNQGKQQSRAVQHGFEEIYSKGIVDPIAESFLEEGDETPYAAALVKGIGETLPFAAPFGVKAIRGKKAATKAQKARIKHIQDKIEHDLPGEYGDVRMFNEGFEYNPDFQPTNISIGTKRAPVNYPKMAYNSNLNLNRRNVSPVTKDVLSMLREGKIPEGMTNEQTIIEAGQYLSEIGVPKEILDNVPVSKLNVLSTALRMGENQLAINLTDFVKKANVDFNNPKTISKKTYAELGQLLDGSNELSRVASEYAASAGRNLQSYNIKTGAGKAEANFTKFMKEIQKENKSILEKNINGEYTPKSKEIIAETAKAIRQMDMNNPVEMSQFLRKFKKATTGEQIYEMWINGRL
jgi:hypothetical protein